MARDKVGNGILTSARFADTLNISKTTVYIQLVGRKAKSAEAVLLKTYIAGQSSRGGHRRTGRRFALQPIIVGVMRKGQTQRLQNCISAIRDVPSQ